jgi:hypothetical protein
VPQLLGPLSVFSVVVATCVELAKIGVAGDAEKRLRELQVGSPVEPKLTLTRPYAERRDTDAVADDTASCRR